MPGTAHEVLVVALREQPSPLGALVAKLTGVSLPRGLVPVDAAVRFVKAAEVRPDLLFAERRRRWVIVELQSRRDPAKRRRWPLAASVLFDQTGALGDVIVITARRDVARWALTVAHTRTRLGTRLALTPIVLHLGEREVRMLLDERRPELALFAAWAVAHRHGPDALAVVERAIELTEKLPASLQHAQMDAIVSVLSQRMFALLREASMDPAKIPMSPARRKFMDLMTAQGRKQGLKEGRVEGCIEGLREALLSLLDARGLALSAEQRAIVADCTDPAKLDGWIVRAASATSAAEVLAPAKRPRAKPAARKPASTRKATARRAQRA